MESPTPLSRRNLVTFIWHKCLALAVWHWLLAAGGEPSCVADSRRMMEEVKQPVSKDHISLKENGTVTNPDTLDALRECIQTRGDLLSGDEKNHELTEEGQSANVALLWECLGVLCTYNTSGLRDQFVRGWFD